MFAINFTEYSVEKSHWFALQALAVRFSKISVYIYSYNGHALTDRSTTTKRELGPRVHYIVNELVLPAVFRSLLYYTSYMDTTRTK